MDQLTTAPQATRDARSASDSAADPPPARDGGGAMDLLGRWLDLSELERRVFLSLARELTLSSDLVETSTLELSERFQRLATLARAQIGRVDEISAVAKSIHVNGEVVPLDSAMRSVEDVLRKVIETILQVSKHAMRMVYALDDVSRDVVKAEKCVAQIEAINRQTRYLALNAAIEANRSGTAGAAFRVIASEISDLARATNEASAQVRERIGSVAAGIQSGHKVLHEIATLDTSEHIVAKERLSALIGGVMAQSRTFAVVIGDTATASAEMAGTIGQLIMGMQFQDRTKQHIAHVVDVLKTLEEGTVALQAESRAAFPGAFDARVLDAAQLHRLVERQTLGEVKQRLLNDLFDGRTEASEAAPPPRAETAADDGDDIELF
jgi:methyl-accepting chemotaxis protein